MKFSTDNIDKDRDEKLRSIDNLADGYRKINRREEWLDYYPDRPEKERPGDQVDRLFSSDTVEEFIQLHQEKFAEYWSLNENEEELLSDFVDQFCRMISGKTEKERMGKLIEDITSLDNVDKNAQGENQ